MYTFTKDPLDTKRKDNIIELLNSIYGGEITIVTQKKDLITEFNWDNAIEYIKEKGISKYDSLINVTSFTINNIPQNMIDIKYDTDKLEDKLTENEYYIGPKLSQFNLDTLKFPEHGPTAFTKGYGFTDPTNDDAGIYGSMIITLVEK